MTGILKELARTRAGVAGLSLTGAVGAVAFLVPVVVPLDPHAMSALPLQPPSMTHLMGTDALGRDLFSGVVAGARMSLRIALSAGLLAFVCGTSVGMIAGYRGGFVDDALMRITEMFQVLPRFFLVVIAVAVFGPGPAGVALILGLTSWTALARVVRAEVLSTRSLEFVLSSEALGATRAHVLRRVLLPHVIPGALVMLGLILSQLLLVEASLGFIGLGDPGAMTWGLLAGQAQGYLRVAWWLPLFPGLAITVTVVGLNLLADSFAAVSRPRLRASDLTTGPV